VLFAGYNAAAADRSIVVLDMQKALTDSEVGKKAQQAMEKKVAELQEKFKKDEEELLALQEEIEKKSSVWSEEKKQEKAIEYQKKRRDLRVKQDDANLELKQLQEQQLGPILKEMEKVVADVAKKKGYKIILPKAAVVHTDESVEITTEITEALNGIDN
jgi:outer membrane protein